MVVETLGAPDLPRPAPRWWWLPAAAVGRLVAWFAGIAFSIFVIAPLTRQFFAGNSMTRGVVMLGLINICYATILGTIVGAIEWQLLRRYFVRPGLWIGVTALGALIAALASNGLTQLVSMLAGVLVGRLGLQQPVVVMRVIFAVTGVISATLSGAISGMAQWLVLRRTIANALAWPVAVVAFNLLMGSIAALLSFVLGG